jgi:hypothetical protein
MNQKECSQLSHTHTHTPTFQVLFPATDSSRQPCGRLDCEQAQGGGGPTLRFHTDSVKISPTSEQKLELQVSCLGRQRAVKSPSHASRPQARQRLARSAATKLRQAWRAQSGPTPPTAILDGRCHTASRPCCKKSDHASIMRLCCSHASTSIWFRVLGFRIRDQGLEFRRCCSHASVNAARNSCSEGEQPRRWRESQGRKDEEEAEEEGEGVARQ